jgi:hypothetical protein
MWIVKRVQLYGPATSDQIMKWILNQKGYKVKYMHVSQLNKAIPIRIVRLVERGFLEKNDDVYIFREW